MGLTYLTDLQPKADPAHDCGLPCTTAPIFMPGAYGSAPESHRDVIVRCDCGQHWHANNGWWWPISQRRARRMVARRTKAAA